jgi:hypothetical protein
MLGTLCSLSQLIEMHSRAWIRVSLASNDSGGSEFTGRWKGCYPATADRFTSASVSPCAGSTAQGRRAKGTMTSSVDKAKVQYEGGRRRKTYTGQPEGGPGPRLPVPGWAFRTFGPSLAHSARRIDCPFRFSRQAALLPAHTGVCRGRTT